MSVAAALATKPVCIQRSAGDAVGHLSELSHGVEGDLRIVGAGLDGDVAAACEPAAAGSPWKFGSSAKASGRWRARPKRSWPSCSNRLRSKAEGDAEPGRRKAERVAAVRRGTAEIGLVERGGGLPGSHPP